MPYEMNYIYAFHEGVNMAILQEILRYSLVQLELLKCYQNQ